MWTFTWRSLTYFDLIMFVRWKNEIIQYLGQSRPHKFKLRPLDDILRHLKDVQTPRLNIVEHLEAKIHYLDPKTTDPAVLNLSDVSIGTCLVLLSSVRY